MRFTSPNQTQQKWEQYGFVWSSNNIYCGVPGGAAPFEPETSPSQEWVLRFKDKEIKSAFEKYLESTENHGVVIIPLSPPGTVASHILRIDGEQNNTCLATHLKAFYESRSNLSEEVKAALVAKVDERFLTNDPVPTSSGPAAR